MSRGQFLVELGAVLFFLLRASGAVHYVDPGSPGPVPPYLDWSTAAANIQDAVDASSPGDQVVVTNGSYFTGSRVSSDGATNRVVVTNAITLQSVNGAAVTTINGGNSVRCVYLTNGASLVGFTVAKGNATSGGGVYCSSTNVQLLNCLLTLNSGKFGGGVYSGTLSNCTVSSNSVVFSGSGGGAYNSTLLNCTITGNSTLVNGGSGAGAVGGFLANCTINNNVCNGSGSTVGGGVSGSVLTNCTLSGNKVTGAGSSGGGANASVLNNCILSNNRADFAAGGAYNCTLTNCTISGNRVSYGGGGVSGGTLVNCVLRNNDGYGYGGGVYWTTTLINCTLVGNTAQYGAGGYSCTFYNSIIYYNSGLTGPNTYGCTYSYCCTPDSGGVGNITNAPIFVNQAGGDLHLQAGSGGIDAGTNTYAWSLTDKDGNLRIANGIVDMGAYEFQQPNPANVAITCNYTDVVVGITASFKGIFSRGRTDSWDFGDGTVISNQVFVTHSWAEPGDYPVTLTIFDDDNPGGVSGVYVLHVIPPPLSYVDPASANPVPPFSSWETAATNIQDAVDAVIFGAHILVTNGTYQFGGRAVYGSLTNRLVINKPVLVQSVNGPSVTAILGNPVLGDSAVRCAYLTNGATLNGFTLLNGATRAAADANKEQSGGGAFCESNAVVSNCLIISNKANVFGGGVRGGSLTNCSLIANSATGSGGAAYSNLLSGCLLSNNTAIIGYGPISGGGASSCTLVGCTLVSNITDTPYAHPASGGGAVDSTLINCSLIGNSGKDGGGANNSTLRNCALVANTAASSGGGAAASKLINCSIISNSSASVAGGCIGSTCTNCVVQKNTSAYQGGGACSSFLYNSLITDNNGSLGGGASSDPYGTGCTLVNCTVVGNLGSFRGGGVANSTVWNSIIVSNSSPDSPNWNGGTLNYSCTTPLPEAGVGNTTNAPLFVDQPGGNFQLQTNSPCINAGTNGYVPSGPDLAGNPRIVSGTVDLGAYECQSPALIACFAWLQSYGLSTYASSLYADADQDGMNNLQEWAAGTDPTNANSNLRLQSLVFAPTGLRLRWNSDAAHTYFVQRATSLTSPMSFTDLQTNIAGLAGTTEFTDTTLPATGVAFYRIGTANGGTPPQLEMPVYLRAKVTLTWSSVTNRTYFVVRSTNLSAAPAWSLLQSNIAGLDGATSFIDSNPPAQGAAFYRVGTQR